MKLNHIVLHCSHLKQSSNGISLSHPFSLSLSLSLSLTHTHTHSLTLSLSDFIPVYSVAVPHDRGVEDLPPASGEDMLVAFVPMPLDYLQHFMKYKEELVSNIR